MTQALHYGVGFFCAYISVGVKLGAATFCVAGDMTMSFLLRKKKLPTTEETTKPKRLEEARSPSFSR